MKGTKKNTASNGKQKAARAFTDDFLSMLLQLEDRLSVMVNREVEAAVERKFRQMGIYNNNDK